MSKFDYNTYIENNTLRIEASRRGGGIEIDATEYLGEKYSLKMTAYQNYLGGGITGAIGGSIEGILNEYPKTIQTKAIKLNEALKYYFYCITNDLVADYDEWAVSDGFEAQQSRRISAY